IKVTMRKFHSYFTPINNTGYAQNKLNRPNRKYSLLNKHYDLKSDCNKTFEEIKIVEVGPRDGIQGIKTKIFTIEERLEHINKLIDAGVKHIEVGSFVSDRIPQMKSTDEVCKMLDKTKDVNYIALVPNIKYMDRALKSKVTEIAVFTSISN